ncbi:MAG: hypothetical protein HYZ74_00455, partial [Elusimicrobia bacterium]|nr:hypothetical protein [Elusimicrobiota bacterium]
MTPRGRDLVRARSSHPGLDAFRRLHLKETVSAFLAAASAPCATNPSHRQAAALIKACLKTDPVRTMACFASPTISTPIHCYAGRERWPPLGARLEDGLREALCLLLLELAIRGLIPAGIKFDWLDEAIPLFSPSIGARLHAPAQAAGWRFESGVLTVLERHGSGAAIRLAAKSLQRGRREVNGLRSELAYVPLRGDILLALADNNPIAQTETHPDKNGNVFDLGGHSEDDWRMTLTTALDWIAEHSPDLFAEMGAMLRQLVPIGYEAQRHLSASYREAIGTIYLTLHPNVLIITEAIVHEFQHNKLNVGTYTGPMLHNAFSPLYPSPVRPDPRPLFGVLMAVHAFLPVAAF